MIETKHYQIRIFWKGKIEIFQSVFTHNIGEYGTVKWINIKYGKPGNYRVSQRKIMDAYDIKIFDDPMYMPESSHVGINIIVN